jgi:hypothetical protein
MVQNPLLCRSFVYMISKAMRGIHFNDYATSSIYNKRCKPFTGEHLTLEGKYLNLNDSSLSLSDGHLSWIDGRLSLINGHLSLIDGHLCLIVGPLSLINGHLSWIDMRLSLIDKHLSLIDVRLSLIVGHLSLVDKHLSLVGGRLTLIVGHLSLIDKYLGNLGHYKAPMARYIRFIFKDPYWIGLQMIRILKRCAVMDRSFLPRTGSLCSGCGNPYSSTSFTMHKQNSTFRKTFLLNSYVN